METGSRGDGGTTVERGPLVPFLAETSGHTGDELFWAGGPF